jgi:hypothetical protein
MGFKGHILFGVAMLAAAGSARAQSPDADWISYRDAYRAMVVFEKYGKPKNLLQHHLQASPREKAAPLEGLKLRLVGKTTQLELPLDAAGRTVFPLLKAAYDENAALALNQKASAYVFRSRVSIAPRADGIYEAAELRAACEQALAWHRHVDASQYGARKCSGVRFVYAKKGGEAIVKVRKAAAEMQQLPVADGAAFAEDANTDAFRTVSYKFADWPATGQVVTQSTPLTIAAMFD